MAATTGRAGQAANMLPVRIAAVIKKTNFFIIFYYPSYTRPPTYLGSRRGCVRDFGP
jgi:hypothetical protein